jgi:hypothetical protein
LVYETPGGREAVVTPETGAKHAQKTEDALRGIFLADEADGLGAWNTDQLLEEVLQRSAGDAPALQRMQEIILRALLAAV